MVILGYQTTLGDGLVTTTDAGLITAIMVGFGFPVINGLRLGLAGVMVMDMQGGLH